MPPSKQVLQAEIKSKINQQFQDASVLESYILQTLDNFGYRYFTQYAPAAKQGQCFFTEHYEVKMVEALKTNQAQAKEGIKQLARTVPVKDRPTVRMQIGCEILQLSGLDENSTGSIQVFALLNWDWPLHALDSAKQFKQTARLDFEDFLSLRNNLPRVLEEVCQIF